jgi:hypothetical protein
LGRELDGEQPPVRGKDFEPAHTDAGSLASHENLEKLWSAKEFLVALSRPKLLERQADKHAIVEYSSLLPEALA